MKKFQVLGIGNSIVDVLTWVDSAFVEKLGIEQGIMPLVDRERAETLYNDPLVSRRTRLPAVQIERLSSEDGNYCKGRMKGYCFGHCWQAEAHFATTCQVESRSRI
jgi:hypothetical protein